MHRTNPDFREKFARLEPRVQAQARRAFELLKQNPRHPSLHFKRLDDETWSVRVGLQYRALAKPRGDDFIWYWTGPHAEYDVWFGGE